MPSSSSSTTREPAITIATSPVNAKYRELHRQLESKWLSAMNSTPSAEAKKSRKIRKLVLDGIPASVRGVVWLYLTDSKGRRMPGLYEKLCMRGKVAASDEIWMDIQSHFSGHIHLCDPDGPLMSLLQAYFCMVPDTEYNYSLSLVAGHVLLQTPEEDAFWTFVALMDNHLRGYFSSVARLLEIDSLLFEKALNTYDKSIAVRLFNTLQVSPLELCRNWCERLFSVTLPSSHLNRTWDVIMLFETAPILFRIGLAIISFAQPYIMNPARCRTGAEALAYLSQPPAEIFPPDPDQIVQTAMSVKLKEDELRKMRSKVEHEVRKRSVLPRTATFR
ncbi:rab-GTPase-TBC domain-containing protein [Cantharellus anzutake]|uniref:rab-GTPase-TBC domain-containing protein n=1 Tax=Cantharellus anzutake TaxID=1750568 RepID=UPI00190854BB|nr:rab-GTPase-TBC domain-containing protein [Cantharellus anzutake]KAF8329853.1 rab-GTPase-TBC domain-containing protein [Cantharellus anzutake]